MKRILLSILAMICLLFSTAYAADVYTSIENGYAWIHTGNGSVGIPNASFSITGNGNQTSVFFVESYGAATITLKQTKGKCTLLSYTKLWSGITGTAQEWGKYNIECHHLDTRTYTTYSWDDTYYNEDIKIKLNQTGDYYIIVKPFSNSEMTDSYVLDQFYGWENPPVWKISSYKGCNVLASPRATATPVPVVTAAPTTAPTYQNTTSNSNSFYSSSAQATTPPRAEPTSPPTYGTSYSFPIIGETCYIYDDGNNVRSGPGINYSVIGQVNTGASFLIYDYEMGSTGKDWYQIYFNNQFGWISSGIVELHGHTEGTVYGVKFFNTP